MKAILKFRQFLCLAFFASILVLTASCSKSDIRVINNGYSTDLVVPYAEMQNYATARASGILSDNVNEALDVSVFRVDEIAAGGGLTGTKKHFTGKWNPASENKIAFTSAQFFLKENKKTAMLAVYPATGAADNASTATSYDYTIDGNTDIIGTKWAIGYREAAGEVVTLHQPSMKFYHLLTMVKIKAFLDEGVSETSFGDVTKVSINGIYRKGQLTFPEPQTDSNTENPTISAASQPETGAIDLNIEGGSALVTGTNVNSMTEIGYAMLVPMETKGISLTITTENGGVFTVHVPPGTYEAGKINTISLRFVYNSIEIQNLTIEDWDEEGGYSPGPIDIN